MEKLNENSIWVFKGVERTLSEWCEIYSINIAIIRARVRKGWTVRASLITPVEKESEYKFLKMAQTEPKFDTYKEMEKDVPVYDHSKNQEKREQWAFNLMYGKDNINQLTTY